MSILVKSEDEDLKCRVETVSPDRTQSRKRRRVAEEEATEALGEDKKKLKLLKNVRFDTLYMSAVSLNVSNAA